MIFLPVPKLSPEERTSRIATEIESLINNHSALYAVYGRFQEEQDCLVQAMNIAYL